MENNNKDTDRVRRNTPKKLNEEIDREIKEHIEFYSAEGKEFIDERLKALDKEWDVERNIEIIAPSIILGGLALGRFVNKKWLILPGVVATFLLQHGLQGWCPPVTILRLLKIRTKGEINKEKYALKTLKGDFDSVANQKNTNTVLEAVS